MLRCKWYLMVFVCLLTAFQGIAQDTTDEELFDISETLTVSAATVEVVVTDKKGERINGLKREDFVLLVDGSIVQPNHFSEIRLLHDGEEQEVTLSGEAHDEAIVSSQDVPRNYLVFIDNYFTHRYYRKMLLKKVIADVDQMRPQDQMAIVVYSGKKPQTRTGWTGDRELLKYMLNEVIQGKSGSMRREAELQASDVETEWKSGSGITGRTVYAAMARLERSINKVTRAVEETMRGFERPKGRNMLLLLSAGWPYQYRKALDVKFVNLSGYDDGGEKKLRPVTDTANLLGYTIYPMLIGQLDAGEFAGADGPKFADFGTNTRFEVGHDSLKFLADQTGGELLSKAQFHKEPLDKVAADNNQYYVLTFTSSGLKKGERHSIDVMIPGTSYKVRHRKAFRQRTMEEVADLEVEKVLFSNKKKAELEVTLGEPAPHDKRLLMVPISLDIPLDWAQVNPQGRQYRARFTLRVTAEDKRGNRADLVREPIDLTVAKPRPGARIGYDAALVLRKKEQRLVVSLQDELGGQALTSTMIFSPEK